MCSKIWNYEKFKEEGTSGENILGYLKGWNLKFKMMV